MQASDETKVHVKVNWEPFFLNQNTPDEGEDLMEHLMKKYGPAAVERFGKEDNPLSRAGQKVGISFNKTRRVINTLKAHRLMEYCKTVEPEKENDLMQSLFKSYFERANDLNRTEQLLKCAKEVGLKNLDETEGFLASPAAESETKSKALSWSRKGVSGVPFFIFESNTGGKPVAFSGAQPPDVIAELMTDLTSA
jgi:predicted DsbA family dithiol-disulfide isomerase|eukprot:Stramenopile-MAST_4_protein_2247